MNGPQQNSSEGFSADSLKFQDVSGRIWDVKELHSWLSYKPNPVHASGAIPPLGKAAYMVIAGGVVAGLACVGAAGYYGYSKMEAMRNSFSDYQTAANTDYSYLQDNTAPEDAPAVEAPPEEPAVTNDENQVTGELTEESSKISTGEYAYQLDLTVPAGNIVTVDLLSDDFETYLIILGPNGEEWANDSLNESPTQSRITFTAEQGGIYNVIATSNGVGKTGSFQIRWMDGEP